MEPSRATSRRGKVTTVFVSALRARGPSNVRGLRECFFKAAQLMSSLLHLGGLVFILPE